MIESFIKNFVTAFILFAWFSSQVNRVVKQKKVEDNFEKILERVNHSISTQNDSFKETIRNLTGGDSFGFITVVGINNPQISGYTVITKGKYPLFDVSLRIHDCNNNGRVLNLVNFIIDYMKIGNCHPGQINFHKKEIKVNREKGIRWNCTFNARNGRTVQLLRMEFHDGKWRLATLVKRGNEIIYEQIDSEFPIQDRELIFKENGLDSNSL